MIIPVIIGSSFLSFRFVRLIRENPDKRSKYGAYHVANTIGSIAYIITAIFKYDKVQNEVTSKYLSE